MFNPRPAYCAFALATAGFAVLPAPKAAAAVNAYIIFTDKDGFITTGPNIATAPEGSNFTISIKSDVVTPDVSSFDFQLSFLASALDVVAVNVNPHSIARFVGNGITPPNNGTPDATLSFGETLSTVQPNFQGGFGPGTVDLADVAFTVHRPIDRSQSADIALLNVVARDSFGNIVQSSLDSSLKVTLTAAPEPVSLAMLTVGAAPLLLRRKKLKRHFPKRR